MYRGRRGVQYSAIIDHLKNYPGRDVIELAQCFNTTRGAMGSRLTTLFRQGDLVKRDNGITKPVSWYVAGKL